MKVLSLLAASFAALSATAVAAPMTVDFTTDQNGNALSAGTAVTNQYNNFFTVTGVGNSVGGPAMIFDTNNPTGGDTDLQSPLTRSDGSGEQVNFGNVLILSEDNNASNPDDDGQGGTITIDFNSPVTFFSMDILDQESVESVQVSLLDISGAIIGSVLQAPTAGGDRTFSTISSMMGISGVSSIVVNFVNASGAIDNIVFDPAPVPVPAALPLMAAGLAGGAWMRRRSAKAKA